MRKVILLTAFIAVAVGLKAQNAPFPDGGFESSWEKHENPVQGKADYWDFKDNYLLTTLNQLHELSGEMGDAPLTAFREEGGNVYNGNYSLKVVSDQMIFGDTSIFLPGVAATLYINFTPVDCILGQPFTSRPTAIKGFYKYIPVNGDSAAIEVRLEKSGTVLGGGKQVIYTEVSTWTQFDIPINYLSDEVPDTIVVIFASSANYDFTSLATLMACQGQIGSALYLDDVEFDYTEPENITDGGFENCWVTKQDIVGIEYEDFNDNYFFNSLNSLKNITGPLTAYKDSVNVHEENYALKLVSENLMGFLFLPGAMGNITLQYGENGMPNSVTLGRPFTSRPTAIKGWHKYIPVYGDSAAIEILLKKNGTIIGSGKQIITSEVPDWSEFNVPVNYTSYDKPDVIIILFATSADYDFTDVNTLMQCKGQVGSALYLDDLELDYSYVGIKEMLYPEISMRVYPNPSR
ncbi:MAG: PCMD domain-containing protein, partial [Bacteroidales bacterium]|nr:PCMD domain-containing protein [Bacteroidales bacterium]